MTWLESGRDKIVIDIHASIQILPTLLKNYQEFVDINITFEEGFLSIYL